MTTTVTIGQAATASGVSAKMIRHYEAIGLVPRGARTEAGYRLYGPDDVHTLRFIRRARDLGFSIAEIGELLALWHDRARASAQVRRIAQRHVADLERRIAQATSIKRTLEHLVRGCRGDARPQCPILDALEDD